MGSNALGKDYRESDQALVDMIVARQAIFWRKVKKSARCWLWQGCKSDFGHGQVRMCWKLMRAHRVSWMLTHGPISDGLCVLHHCDIPACVRPGHLFLGTKADNTADMMRKGRNRCGNLRGEAHGGSKLTTAQVVEMRQLYRGGSMDQYQLAARYKISQGTVGFVLRRETWRHV